MSEIIEKETIKQALKPPVMWDVILLNDDFTTMEFVIICLMGVFGKTQDEAMAITMEIHHKGRGVVARYSKDIALTKAQEAKEFAQSQDHPLQVVVEPEA